MGKNTILFVCDDEGDCKSGAVIWRVAFHEFARTRRARCRDRKRALMARALRRARVEHNRQLPWLPVVAKHQIRRLGYESW